MRTWNIEGHMIKKWFTHEQTKFMYIKMSSSTQKTGKSYVTWVFLLWFWCKTEADFWDVVGDFAVDYGYGG